MFKNLLNHVWRKPQSQPLAKPADTSQTVMEPCYRQAKILNALRSLENSFILRVGRQRCDTCTMETANCKKLTLFGTDICACPRKDIKGFCRPKKEPKSE